MNLIGIYYPGQSFWHRLDPRSKIIAVMALMITLLASEGIGLALLCLIIVLLYPISKLPWRLEWETLLKFKWLLLIPFIINLMAPFNQNNWYLTIVTNYPRALSVSGRLFAIILVATWLSYVTKPMVIVEGFSRLLKPFEGLGIGGLDIPLMMGLVVRFIPELFYESENILVAQKIRGIKPGFKISNSSSWIKSTIIPLFFASIRKAAALAIAMEARGYRPGMQRSSIEELKLRSTDHLIIGMAILLIAWQIFKIW
ncbi:MAG: energy-coupling factor transporter transmembrane protein EcfT [Firmicutes bacterium]|nr:energy-coupling factor transporter transmembrane protein EcfT [Bacillota bacterium]